MNKYENLKIKSIEIDGKCLPEEYVTVFNDYIDKISNIIIKEERKNICEQIREWAENDWDWDDFNWFLDRLEKGE